MYKNIDNIYLQIYILMVSIDHLVLRIYICLQNQMWPTIAFRHSLFWCQFFNSRKIPLSNILSLLNIERKAWPDSERGHAFMSREATEFLTNLGVPSGKSSPYYPRRFDTRRRLSVRKYIRCRDEEDECKSSLLVCLSRSIQGGYFYIHPPRRGCFKEL